MAVEGPIRMPFEEHIRNFEATSEGWQLSLSAQVVIQQGLMSLLADTIGMGTIRSLDDRVKARHRAEETLPAFLAYLREKAAQDGSDHRVIGAIFVLQHINHWAMNLFGCTCWPS